MIKSFNEYSSSFITEEVNKQEVKKIGTKPDDIARWKVVLKSSDQGIKSENVGPQIADALVKDQNFIKWWSEQSPVNQELTTKFSNITPDQTVANSYLLPILYKVKEVESNLVGNQVAKYEVAFKPYAVYDPTGTPVFLFDVTLAKAQVRDVKVGNSPILFSAWNSDKLPAIKLSQPKPVPSNIQAYQLNPSFISRGMGSQDVTVATTTTQASVQATQAQQTTGTQVGDFTGLKRTQTFDKRIQDLQRLIIAKGGDAAASINANGGAIGKYGPGTAKAIGILIGTNKEEPEITADINTKLKTALGSVTQDQLAKVQVAAAPAQTATNKTVAASSTTKTTSQSAAKTTTTQPVTITTKGGKTLTII
jgi:hypothetical protein